MNLFLMISLFVNTMHLTIADRCECEVEYGFAFCPYARACPPNHVNAVQVECQIREIQTVTDIPQLLIRGECRNITNFIYLCRYKITEIKLTATGEIFLCQDSSTMSSVTYEEPKHSTESSTIKIKRSTTELLDTSFFTTLLRITTYKHTTDKTTFTIDTSTVHNITPITHDSTNTLQTSTTFSPNTDNSADTTKIHHTYASSINNVSVNMNRRTTPIGTSGDDDSDTTDALVTDAYDIAVSALSLVVFVAVSLCLRYLLRRCHRYRARRRESPPESGPMPMTVRKRLAPSPPRTPAPPRPEPPRQPIFLTPPPSFESSTCGCSRMESTMTVTAQATPTPPPSPPHTRSMGPVK